MIGARDIARAAGARAHARRRLDHRADHLRMLPHAEVIVGAPDDDVTLALRRMPICMRKPARDALEVGKDTIAPLVAQRLEGSSENGVVIHATRLRVATLEIFLFDCREDMQPPTA